ncbi:dTMP kinase [Komagataeibacter melomenusus]
MTGLFITLEGGEGAGKSTQARLLADSLRAQGHDVDLTREPGGTPGAEALRELLLFGGHGLSARAEVMAHFAARADHVDQRIAPMLARGGVVICDRFTDSTEAYQGYGLSHGDPAMLGLIATLRELIPVTPDLTFMLEVPPAVAQARLAGRGDARTDRYEAEGAAFHARVAAGFDTIARRDAARCRRIDASGTPQAVQQALRDAVAPLLPHA